MNKREKFLEVAHTWIGVKWARVGTERDRGVNCLGLLIGIARECGTFPRLMAEKDGANYAKPPVKGEFLRRVKDVLDIIPFKEAIPGDLVLFRVGNEPQHIAILTDLNPIQYIHSDSLVKKVRKTPQMPGWQVTMTFRVQELDE